MEWEEMLKRRLSRLRRTDYEDIYGMCRQAYTEGLMREKALAVEAHRLRFANLFGDHCMNFFGSAGSGKKRCDGNCPYIRKFLQELAKLEN